MTLQHAVSRALTEAVNYVCDELTAQLQAQARDAGVPDVEVRTLYVAFAGGFFHADSHDDAYLEREYGGPGHPPLGLLRRFNQRIPSMAGPLLDKAAGTRLGEDGVL